MTLHLKLTAYENMTFILRCDNALDTIWSNIPNVLAFSSATQIKLNSKTIA